MFPEINRYGLHFSFWFCLLRGIRNLLAHYPSRTPQSHFLVTHLGATLRQPVRLHRSRSPGLRHWDCPRNTCARVRFKYSETRRKAWKICILCVCGTTEAYDFRATSVFRSLTFASACDDDDDVTTVTIMIVALRTHFDVVSNGIEKNFTRISFRKCGVFFLYRYTFTAHAVNNIIH